MALEMLVKGVQSMIWLCRHLRPTPRVLLIVLISLVGPQANSAPAASPQVKASSDVILEIAGSQESQVDVKCPAAPSNPKAVAFSSRTAVLILLSRSNPRHITIADTNPHGDPIPPTVELEPETNCTIVTRGKSDAIVVHTAAPYASTLEWETNTGHGNDLEPAPLVAANNIFSFSVMEPREMSAISQNIYRMHAGQTNVGGQVFIVSRLISPNIPSSFTCKQNFQYWPCPR